MEFIGNKNEIYDSILESENHFPNLSLSDFQTCFHYLANESEQSITFQLRLARLSVNSELRGIDIVSGDDIALYQNAVFSLCACNLLDIQLSSDTTKEAAGRQEALTDKRDLLLYRFRASIDLLLNKKSTTSFHII